MAQPGDVRKLLRQQQTQRQQSKKIEHVFAKYDNQGRLGCVVCEIVIKTEQLWSPHLQSNQHKEKIARLKAIKQQQQQKHLSKKRPIDDTSSSSGNGGDAALLSKRARFDQIEKEFEEEAEEEQEDEEDNDDDDDESMDEENEENELPADFFDTPTETTTSTERTMKASVQHDLPTGFFDNPDEEAKVKQITNPKELQEQKLNDEYEAFKELMAETAEETDKMQEHDEETILLDRDITLARQQLELDEKVQRLKYLRNQPTEILRREINKKKSDGQKKTFTKSNTNNTDDGDSSWTTGLKSSVRQVMKKNDSKKQSQPIFDDDMDEDEEDEEDDDDDEFDIDDEEGDEKDWRAQHI